MSIFNPSDIERFLLWKGAIAAWWQHPIFGWGWANFLQAFRANRGVDYIDSPAINGMQNSMQNDAHNIFLQILVTTGLAGFSIFIYFLYNVFRFLEVNKDVSPYHRVVRACAYSLFVGAQFEPISFSCWLLIAMLIGSIA